MGIRTENLAIGYKPGHSLAASLNLELRDGQVVSLIGGNGVGKSTLMRTLCGEQKPLEGEILIQGQPLSGLSRRRRALLMAWVGTTEGMAGGLTVRQLVELGRQPYTGLLGRLSGPDRELCRWAMEATGIDYKADALLGTLSDGERQKAMIARALAQDTPIILLDEPLSFLDPTGRLEIMDMLCRITREKQKAILLTCHDVALSLRMASRLWLFNRKGQVLDMSPKEAVDSGAMDTLYDNPKVKFSPEIGDYVIMSNEEWVMRN